VKYIVTGGAGFLGSNLCRGLLNNGDRVVCVDNLSTSTAENIEDLMNEKNFMYLKCDVSDFDLAADVNGIFHLASPAAPGKIMEMPKQTYDANSAGTARMRAVAEAAEAKFLYVSSMKVYGDCGRVQSYIDGKRAGERLCGNGDKVARLGSVYGPRMAKDDSRVIPVFISRALKNEPITLWDGGLQEDSFCYVDDIVEFLIMFMESAHGGIVEAGESSPITILRLAELIVEMTRSISEFNVRTDIQISQDCHRMPNTEMATTLLGWYPKTAIRDGLARTIDYFRG
jgi:nucleoside-diphosphate-sugar epimerase